MANYNVNSIYQGGYSSFKPKYGDVFTGYRLNPGVLGISTDPRTANAIQDASTKVNMGVKQIELTFVSPEIFDAMPKQQLKELNQLSKLTGVDMSVHGPVMDTTGISQQGFSEMDRQAKERKMTDFLMRAQQVNPDKSIPMTFHSSEGIPGTEWKTLGTKEKGREAKKIIAIEKETGRMVPLEEEKRFYPTEQGLKEMTYSPEKNLEIINTSEWDNKISQLFFTKERADEILQKNQIQIQHLMEDISKGNITSESLTPEQRDAYIKMRDAQNYLEEIDRNANAIFSKAYKFGTHEQRERLKDIADGYAKELQNLPGGRANIVGKSRAMHELLNELQNPQNQLTPTMFVPIEEFALEKSAQTFGNAAFNAYKKLGDKAPIVSIENPPAGHALSTGEDLRNLVEASRQKFAENAMKEGKSRNEAEELAKKFIGATWDVGHINMLRKQGFEAKDIVKESEKIAPFVKHVHLSDNFGFEHTELPMGMGNVPTKEIFEKLGKEGFDAAKIIEASSWWQHFRAPPFKESLEAFGSPIYGMKNAPYWNQALGLQQGYFGGYGMMLPQVNYETFGSGFSRLPQELGGQAQSAQGSRMSNRPME